MASILVEVLVMDIRVAVVLTGMIVDAVIEEIVGVGGDMFVCMGIIVVIVAVATVHLIVPLRACNSAGVLTGAGADSVVDTSIVALVGTIVSILSGTDVDLLASVDVNVLRAVMTALEFSPTVSL